MTSRPIKIETIPDVPEDAPEPIKAILKALKNVADIREGRLGPIEPFNVRPFRFITLRDLINAGFPIIDNAPVLPAEITAIEIQNIIGSILTDSDRITLTYVPGESITADLVLASVSNAYLAPMAESTVKGRAVGAGAGDPQDLAVAEQVAILNTAHQFTFTAGGLVKRSVPTGTIATVPDGYCAMVSGHLNLEGTAELNLEGDGELAIL